MANFRGVVFQCSNFLRYTSNFRVENSIKLTLAGLPAPRRSKHGMTLKKNRDNYWVPRKRPLTEDNLTFENRDFLQEVIDARYLKPGESPLREETEERPQFTSESRRAGLITRKIGSYPMWTKEGKRFITTLLQVVDNHVIRYNPPEIFAQSKYANTYKEKTPFASLVVGAESADPQLFTSAYNGLFAEAGVMPKKKLTRFRITPDAAIQPGTPLFATHFKVGQYVNVFGITKYHGFQGVMKRWNFKGGPASHGCTKSHRRPGCIGGGWKNHVFKGKKMPGLDGGFRRLLVGLKLWRINTKYNVLYVHGPAVPGEMDNYCYVYDCHSPEKKALKEDNPPIFPTYYPGDIEDMPEEYYDENLHVFSDPSVILEEEVEVKKQKFKK